MKLKGLKKMYEGHFLTYYVADYENKNGQQKLYEFISRDKNLTCESFAPTKVDGVGMVTFSLDKSKILMQREYRLACNQWVYNFPAGLIDKGETPEIAAKRELKEETGLDLVKIDAVLSPSYASQGTSDEMMVIVVCRCDGEIVNSKDADEEIEASWFTREEAQRLLDENAYMSVRTQMFVWQWIHGGEE